MRYNFDKNADFSIFKTYKWVALKDAAKVDDLTEKQIKEALDTEVAPKGLSKVDGDQADLFIGYQAAIGTEKQFTSFKHRLGIWPWLVQGVAVAPYELGEPPPCCRQLSTAPILRGQAYLMAHNGACGSGQVAETIGSSAYGAELRDWLQSHAIMCFVLRAEVVPYRGTAIGTDSRPGNQICVQCSNSCVGRK